MPYEFQYEQFQYLIDIAEVSDIPEGSEAFEFRYPESNLDPRNFEVRLYRIDNDERVTPLLIAEQTTEFQEALAERLAQIAEKIKTFIANPYFDDVMISYGETIITSKDRYVQITCEQCHRSNLWQRRDKESKTEYIEGVKAKMTAKRNPEWPYTDKLAIQFSVSDLESRLNKIDLDNLSKTVCDSLKGVVFVDDAQIVRLTADKDYIGGLIGNVIAIKRLGAGERPIFQDYLFSGRLDTWKEQYAQKRLLNKPTNFFSY